MSLPSDERPPVEREPEPRDPEPVEGARSTRPLVWLLLLIALAAITWYFASRGDAPVESLEPAVTAEEAAADAREGVGPAADTEPRPAAPARPPPAPPPQADHRAAEPLARVQPAYPAAALRMREEGTVLLRVEVDAQGRPSSIGIERSSRSRDLDRAARDAVAQWTFRPAVENGEPVPTVVTVPVDFRVE